MAPINDRFINKAVDWQIALYEKNISETHFFSRTLFQTRIELSPPVRKFDIRSGYCKEEIELKEFGNPFSKGESTYSLKYKL
jgi:hypothetical protein